MGDSLSYLDNLLSGTSANRSFEQPGPGHKGHAFIAYPNLVSRAFSLTWRRGGKRPWHRLVTCRQKYENTREFKVIS